MTEKTFDEYINSRPKWWKRPIYWVGTGLTALWTVAAWDYLYRLQWWTDRYQFAPAEFVGTILSQLLPIALVWFVIGWLEQRHQFRQEADQIRAYMNQLMYPSEEGALYTKTLTDALRKQISEFKSVFSQLAGQTETIRDDLKKWVKDMATVINHVDTQTVESIKNISKHVEDISKATALANESSVAITKTLAERANILNENAVKVTHLMSEISAVLNENVSGLQTSTEGLQKTIYQTKDLVDATDKTNVRFSQHMDRLQGLIDDYTRQSQEYNSQLFANAEKMVSVFKTQGEILDGEMEKSLHKLSVASEKTSEQAQTLCRVSDDAVRHIADVGTQFVIQADLMNQTLEQTDRGIRALKEEGITGQISQMQEAVRSSQKFIDEIKQELASRQNDRFMKDARFILEHLASVSIDIAHVFTPKAEEELWKKYYSGDNTAFMRYLITAISKDKSEKLRDLYQQNALLRQAVTRYVAEFDALANKAKDNENKDILLPVFIGSDAGRLYMMLKQIYRKKGDNA